MKILVANTVAPFIRGGAELLADTLVEELRKRGHVVEYLKIPFKWEPPSEIIEQMIAVKWLEVHKADKVIALKFPAYLLEHSDKVVWLIHQYRQAYDLFGTSMSNLNGPESRHVREAIIAADNHALGGTRKLFCSSPTTADRLLRFNAINSAVLYPPVCNASLFRNDGFDGYVFAGGRVNSMKRQHLLVEAALNASSSTKLVVAGPVEDEAYGRSLRNLVDGHDGHSRITLDLEFLSAAKYAEYINHCSAVAYIPIDEDALGYVTMEAAIAGKPVITASDSGGTLGLVTNNVTGWVVDPDVSVLAGSLDSACQGTDAVRHLGEALSARLARMGVNWESTIAELLS